MLHIRGVPLWTGTAVLSCLLYDPVPDCFLFFCAIQADSARGNLASTFVNAFVNAGYGTDKLITPADSKWLYRNKDNAVMSVAASLGMILQVGMGWVCAYAT